MLEIWYYLKASKHDRGAISKEVTAVHKPDSIIWKSIAVLDCGPNLGKVSK